MTLSQNLIAEYKSMYPNDGVTLWKKYVKQDFGDLRKPENKAKAEQWLESIKPIDPTKSPYYDMTPAKLPANVDPITGMSFKDVSEQDLENCDNLTNLTCSLTSAIDDNPLWDGRACMIPDVPPQHQAEYIARLERIAKMDEFLSESTERIALTRKIVALRECGVPEAFQIRCVSALLQEMRDYLDTIASTCQVNNDVEITLYYPKNRECFAVIGDTKGTELGRVYGFEAEELFMVVSESGGDNALDFLVEYV